MPFKCHENVYYYRDMFNQDVILASLNKIKEMNRNTEFHILESLPLIYRTQLHSLESLAYPYWKDEYDSWEKTLSEQTIWSVALDSDVPISTLRAYPSMTPDTLTINYLSTELTYRNKGIAKAVVLNCIYHVFKNTDYTSIQAQDISSLGAAMILEQFGFVRNRHNKDVIGSLQEICRTCKT